MIPFSPDGSGNFYCFDTKVKTKNGDSNQIVFWYSNYIY
ncbi:SMI1/KNR4 family protein [Prevotella heparinolytica]